MEKPDCTQEAENYNLVMNDEKCKCCQYLYECKYMTMEMYSVMCGDD